MHQGRRGSLGLVLAVGLLAATIPASGQEAADFPGATWIPALYYTPGRSSYNVQYIVIHATDGERTSGTVNDYGKAKPVEDWASAHYIIGNGVGYPEHEAYAEGQVIQMIHNADTAYGIAVWPAGTPGAKHTGAIHNYNSISIELAGHPDASGWCSEKMYESAAAVVRFLAGEYGIPLKRERILGHDEVARTCVPPITTRVDPCGRTAGTCTFDWSHFMSLITQNPTVPPEPSATSNLAQGLVAYYPFEGNLADASGNGNSGTPVGSVGYAQGKIGQALKLGGVSNVGCVRVSSSPSLSFTTQLSWSCFVRVDGSIGQTSADCSGTPVEGAPQCVIAKRGDRYGLWSNLYVSQGRGSMIANFGINSYTSAPVGIEGTVPYNLGRWIHLAFVYSSGQVIEYVDGVEVARRGSQPTGFSTVNSADLYVGIQRNLAGEACSGHGPDWWYPLNGAIDDLRIYNRALSADEVRALANPSSAPLSATLPPTPALRSATGADLSQGLVAWYSFEGSLSDGSGKANHGLPTGSVSFTQGRVGQAVKLGGIRNPGYIRVPAGASMAVNDEYTFSFFARIDGGVGESDTGGAPALGEPQCPLAKSGDRIGWFFYIYAHPDQQKANTRYGDRWLGPFIDAQLPVQLGSWVHFAVVYDSGQAIQYVNGSEVGRASLLPMNAKSSNAEDLYIGISNCASVYPSHPLVYPLDGAIDEVRIYNRALTADEVRALASPSSAALTGSRSAASSFAAASSPTTAPGSNAPGTLQPLWPVVLGGVLAVALVLLLLRGIGG